jgi:hypothetical protein
MATTKFLLPAGLDEEQRIEIVRQRMMRMRRRRDLDASGHVLDVYPNERGWVDQPGNTDPRRRVYYGIISRWRRKTA